MNTLWFAFIIYILGMAVVLYVRPSLMFDGGAWKEFGLTATNNNTTLFPLWMFVVLWSITSYVLGTLCVLGFSSLSTQGVETADTAETADAAPVAAAPVEEAPVAEKAETEEAAEKEEAAETADASGKPAKAVDELQFNDISKATRQMKKVMEKRKAPRRRNRLSSELPETGNPPKPVPGYYVKGKSKNGKSTYIYYGKEPPFE